MNTEGLKNLSGKLDGWLARLSDSGVRRTLEKATLSPQKAYALLVLASALLYLPGIASIPPVDRDEPRYTQASKQMVETGDYTKMYFQDKFRNKKPIGIYWLQSASVNLFGGEKVKESIWAYRIPSVLCALGSILLVYRLGCLLMAPAPALLAALVFATTPLQLMISRVATTDSTLLFCTLIAQYNLVRILLANRNGEAARLLNTLAFWCALGAGILVKGPITPLVALLTATSLMVLNRDRKVLKGIRPLLGIPLMLAIVLPWLISIQIATDGAFLRESIGADFGQKLVSGQESHGAPPGFYTLLMGVTCWPASLLIVPVLVDIWKKRRTCLVSMIGFSWIFPYLVVIEMVPTKLPHYVSSIYPPIILLCARFAWNNSPPVPGGRILRALHWLYIHLWKLVYPLATAVVLATATVSDHPLVPIAIGLAMAIGVWILHRTKDKGTGCRMATCICLMATTSVLFFGCVMPGLGKLWISRTVADAFHDIEAVYPDAELYAVGYRESSLVFLAGTSTRLSTPSKIENEYSPSMVLFATDKYIGKIGREFQLLKQVDGINYSKGKVVKGGVYVHPDRVAALEFQP